MVRRAALGHGPVHAVRPRRVDDGEEAGARHEYEDEGAHGSPERGPEFRDEEGEDCGEELGS